MKYTTSVFIKVVVFSLSSRIFYLKNLAPAGSAVSRSNGSYVRYSKGKNDDFASIMVVGLNGGVFFSWGMFFGLGMLN